jgi:flavin reductase (DIM6/NTAB) family NADH-FMN oxidoreductase RutF
MCKVINKDININELRDTLGVFPTGVAVVTASPEPGRPVGMTINSFNSISLAPALVGWCIDRSAASFQAFSRCREFTISILDQTQQPVARRFASPGADKFEGIADEDAAGPVVPGAIAWLRCRLYRQVSLGDHLMLVGEVEEFDQVDGDPLVFARGTFSSLVH